MPSLPDLRPVAVDNRTVTFQLSSPTGGGGHFATGSVSRAHGSEGLGFFRLILDLGLVIQPIPPSVTQQDGPMLTGLAASVTSAGKPLGMFFPTMDHFPVRAYTGSAQQTTVPLACDLDRARI